MHHTTSQEVARLVRSLHPETLARCEAQLAALPEAGCAGWGKAGPYSMRKGWETESEPTFEVRMVFGRLVYEVTVTKTEAVALAAGQAHGAGTSVGRGRRVVRIVAGAR